MNWRVLAYAALPLVLWRILPVWAVLALCLLFGVTAWRTGLAPMRFVLGLLLILAVHSSAFLEGLSGGWLADLIPLFALMGLACLALWLVGRAADDAEEKDSRSWLFLLPLALLAPHPLALVSLSSALLLRQGPDLPLLSVQTAATGERSGWLSWGPALAVVFLLSFALPSQSLWQVADQALWVQAGLDQGGKRIYRQNVCRQFYKDGTWAMYVGNGDGHWKEVNPASCTGRKPESQSTPKEEAKSLLGTGHRRSLAVVGLLLLAYLLAAWPPPSPPGCASYAEQASRGWA
ncbi:hypothetical protein [Deinococcus piscis]|uniref:hypothetical protein n=1 Tax=Deinococcus piscis TaxID=394230 RepID=UPI001674CAE7|nr:hypothetical protein [Deinococcus piscis]